MVNDLNGRIKNSGAALRVHIGSVFNDKYTSMPTTSRKLALKSIFLDLY
tara:strand:- start:4525 stop:4671 length:147 start_codon:yes stop_codon:yes gene_type:complete